MFKKTILSNGLRVISVPMSGTKTVTVLVSVATGSRYEKKEQGGISHFLEHMLFKGTRKRPTTLDIASALDSVGGEFNAFTDRELTGYWAKVDMTHTETAFDVISDIFLNSKLARAEIEREKGVIIEEINLYNDMPMRQIDDLFEALLYGNQPAGFDVAGTKKTVLGLSRRDLFAYWKKQYTARNTIIVAAGNVSHSKVLGLTKKLFRKIRKNNPARKLPVKERQNEPRVKIQFKKTDQAHVAFGCRAYDAMHLNRHALSLLAVILGGNMSSRLFTLIRERLGLAYYVHTDPVFYTDSGYLATYVGADIKRVEAAIGAVLRQYKEAAKFGVGADELKKAKDYVKGKFLLTLESSDKIAGFIAEQEVIRREVFTTEEIFDKIDKVESGDILMVARDIFRPEKLNLALIGPFRNKKKFQDLLNVNS